VVPHLPEDAADGHGPEDPGPVGIGAVGVAVAGIVLAGERATPGRLLLLALIVVGVVGLRVIEA
jgi:hypothetical protein